MRPPEPTGVVRTPHIQLLSAAKRDVPCAPSTPTRDRLDQPGTAADLPAAAGVEFVTAARSYRRSVASYRGTAAIGAPNTALFPSSPLVETDPDGTTPSSVSPAGTNGTCEANECPPRNESWGRAIERAVSAAGSRLAVVGRQ